MGYGSACDKIYAHNKASVQVATWGHLAPNRNKKHVGTIVFTETAFGQVHIIDSEFNTVSDSPFFYDDLQNYVFQYSMNLERGEYGIFKFEGHYIKFKNGNGRFTGKVTKIEY